MTLDLLKIDKKIFFVFLTGIALAEFLSFLGFISPVLMNFLTVALSVSFLFVSLHDLRWGIMAILAELILGVYGYLFVLHISGVVVPLRYIFFIIWLSIFFVYALRRGKFKEILIGDNLILFIGIIFVIFFGIVSGFLSGNSYANIFFDANGWLFWLYFLPFSIFIIPWQKLWPLFLALISWLAAKTLFLEFIFSHKLTFWQYWLYQWQRDFRLAEITPISGALNRVFSQSQVFLILPFLIFILYFITKPILKFNLSERAGLVFTLLVIASLYISYSRSFWLGVFLALFIFFGFVFLKRGQTKELVAKKGRMFWLPISFIFSGLILVFALVNFPYPPTLQSSFDKLLTARFDSGFSEPAANARLKMLSPLWQSIKPVWFLGSGFGTTVRYFSSDPRLVATSPGGSGEIVTFAFEWGYLDIWLKIGVLGLIIYLLILIKILAKLTKDAIRYNDIFLFGLAVSFLALLFLNITTPYLNHPLGIGYIYIIILLSASYKEYKKNAAAR